VTPKAPARRMRTSLLEPGWWVLGEDGTVELFSLRRQEYRSPFDAWSSEELALPPPYDPRWRPSVDEVVEATVEWEDPHVYGGGAKFVVFDEFDVYDPKGD
jgi:hypothetical protein